MNIDISFTHTSIDLAPSRLPSREIGAVVEFQGIVREMEGSVAVAGLSYEAYEAMARRVLEGHVWELAVLHPCEAVVFVHRLGFVPLPVPLLLLVVGITFLYVMAAEAAKRYFHAHYHPAT